MDSSSGGVGEEIGNHSVRFNEDTNTVTEDPRFYGYNVLKGRNNELIDCIKTSIGGADNEGENVTESIIDGVRNTVYGSHHVIVTGADNDVNSLNDGIVAGRNNTVTNDCSVTAGQYNEGDQLDAITAGNHNKAAPEGLTVGQYCQFNLLNRIVVGDGSNSGNRSNSFYVTWDGEVYAKGSYNTIGADYAEYFEWADGNTNGEDRRGMLVQLIGDKIAPAHGDDILGAVSCRASVIGNAYDEHWHGKYKTDVFGAYIPDKDGRPQLSDDYDPERKYIPRSQRQEWAAVGLVGRLIICDNGKCEPGGYVTARQGVGAPTFKETRARCIRRLDESHIEIIVR